MDCQIENSSEAAKPLSAVDRVRVRLVKLGGRARRLWGLAAHDRGALLDRLAGRRPAAPTERAPRRAPLDLQAGERVRVRSVAEIRATLDERGRLAGLAYMPEMERFAGRELTVKKRVALFFDERTREMRKVKGIVLLEGATCEGRLGDASDYSGCDRCCFLFWKEDWLERVTP